MQIAQAELFEKMLLSSALLQNFSGLKFVSEAQLESYQLASVTRVDTTCLASVISHCFFPAWTFFCCRPQVWLQHQNSVLLIFCLLQIGKHKR